MNNQELSLYIAKYEVITKRLESLKMIKTGFNILNTIEVYIFLFFLKKKNTLLKKKIFLLINSQLEAMVGTKLKICFTKS